MISALSVPLRVVQAGIGIPGIGVGFVIFLFLLVAIYYILPRPKSFFLDVTTDYLEVTTDLDAQIIWEIQDGLLCLPRHRLPVDHPDTNALRDGKDCGAPLNAELPDRYVDHGIAGVELDWPNDVKLVLRSGANGALDVLVQFDSEVTTLQIGNVTIVPETILRIYRSGLESDGGLGLSGDLVIGQTAEHGTLKMLRDGRYETREKPFFRTNALLVDSGSFAMGDAISIEAADDGKRLSSYAFVTHAEAASPGGSHLRVIATSPEVYSRLRLERARANPSYIEPNWSQRIANDPLAIGLATLLSLLATFFGVLNNVFRR